MSQTSPPPGLSRTLTFVLAFSCGAVVANLYYVQPLVGIVGPEIGLPTALAGLIVTLTQLGYAAGLLVLVPLGDQLENRRLVVVTLCCGVVALIGAALAPSAGLFLTASFLIGATSVSAQMMVPIAAHLTPERSRGRAVGNVMSGLLLGILLARPIGSLVAHALGWRAVFALGAGLLAVLAVVLRLALPERRPAPGLRYGQLLLSLWPLLRGTRVLQRRALYHACLFASFSLFWTGAPILLSGPVFGLSQAGIALFALSGAAGALVAPLAGRLADRGYGRVVTGIALASVAAAFVLARIGGHGSLASLVVAGIVLDSGVQANLVTGQRAIYTLGDAVRSRLNGLYMAIFFTGGALGSALTSPAMAWGGWNTVTWLGVAFPVAALLLFASEFWPVAVQPKPGSGAAGTRARP